MKNNQAARVLNFPQPQMISQARLERFLALRQNILDLLSIWEQERDSLRAGVKDTARNGPVRVGRFDVQVDIGEILHIKSRDGKPLTVNTLQDQIPITDITFGISRLQHLK